MGLFDDISTFIGGSDDASTADPRTGLTQAQRRAVGFNGLSQAGALLMAAGEPMGGNQRAGILAQLGNVPGNMQQQTLSMQQQRMLGQQSQKVAADLASEKRITDDVNAELPNLPAEMRSFAQANPVEFSRMRAGKKLDEIYRKPSDTELKLQMILKATGGNQDLAAGILSGVIDVKSDGQGGFVMINKATGQATLMCGQQDGASKFGINTAPPAQQPTQPGATPAQYPNASVPGNLPYRDAFGLTGANMYVFGKAQDLVERQMTGQAAKVNDAITRLEMVNNQAIDALKENVDGVSRLKDSHRRIVEMLPTPGNLFSGPSYASKQYGALMDELGKEIGIETQNLNSPGTATIKSKSAERVRRLSAARDNVATVLQQFGGQSQPNVPPADNQYEYRRNPETGRLQRRLK